MTSTGVCVFVYLWCFHKTALTSSQLSVWWYNHMVPWAMIRTSSYGSLKLRTSTRFSLLYSSQFVHLNYIYPAIKDPQHGRGWPGSLDSGSEGSACRGSKLWYRCSGLGWSLDFETWWGGSQCIAPAWTLLSTLQFLAPPLTSIVPGFETQCCSFFIEV